MKRTYMVPDLQDQPSISFKEWEEKLLTHYQTYTRATYLKNASDSQLRLIGGEMTAQEIRTVRAFLNYISS